MTLPTRPLLVGICTWLLTLGLASTPAAQSTTAPAIDVLAEEAYTFAYPMLEQYRTMRDLVTNPQTHEVEAQRYNQFVHNTALADDQSRLFVRPNNDTLYSQAVLDLRTEPVVIHMPAVPADRYWSLLIIDAYTHNVAIFGRRTGAEAGRPGEYLIAGPDWKGDGSAGLRQVARVESRLAVAFIRQAVYGPDDVANVRALQEQIRITPLHVHSKRRAPAPAPPLMLPAYRPEAASGAGFVDYFNRMLEQVVVHPSERALIERWAPLGVGRAGRAPDVDTARIDAGVKAAQAKMLGGITGSARRGVWSTASHAFGSRDRLQGQYLVRATAAKYGIWGLDREEAVYASAGLDADGAPLNGATKAYTLRFEPGRLPPAEAFWSLVVYDADGFLVANPVQRFSIGDRTRGLQRDADGGLTLFIQADAPGGDRAANWLPAPRGRFTLTLRMYYPTDNGTYVPPAPRVVR